MRLVGFSGGWGAQLEAGYMGMAGVLNLTLWAGIALICDCDENSTRYASSILLRLMDERFTRPMYPTLLACHAIGGSLVISRDTRLFSWLSP